MKRIRLDATSISVVVTCVECPHWFSFRFDKREAWLSAREHEKQCHPGAQQATNALQKYRDSA